MGKIYIQKYNEIPPFTIWIVNGSYIRKNLDEEFTNFGQHYRFRFIPKNEFWIDQEFGDGNEMRYFIDHLLTEFKLMDKGMDYDTALIKADHFEKKERKKYELIKHQEKGIINIVHRKMLKKYPCKLKIWIINGRLVRDFFFIDFTEGGHDLVYHFVPKNEIWLDDDLNPKEMSFVLLHELHERNLMAKAIARNKRLPKENRKKLSDIYSAAHHSASKIEFLCRHNQKLLQRSLQEELNKC